MTDRDKFNKFTERARKVLSLAQEEAQRFQHDYIGTEHILLGLIREGEGVGAQVLVKQGADLNRVRQAVVERLSGAIGTGEAAAEPSAKDLQWRMVRALDRIDRFEESLRTLRREIEEIRAASSATLPAAGDDASQMGNDFPEGP